MKSRFFRPIRHIAAGLVLLALLLAGQFVADADGEAIDRSPIAFSGEFASGNGIATEGVHRAGVFQEIIDLLQEIIDILDGKKPIVVNPDPILTDEERDSANEGVDDAEDEGVDVPEERIEANWNYEETRGFLTLVIDLIEDFRQGGGE